MKRRQRAFRARFGHDLAVPSTWDELQFALALYPKGPAGSRWGWR